MEKDINKNILIIGGVLLVIVFFIGGFFIGQTNGKNTGQALGEAKYKSVVEAIYPKPPEELHSLSGKVTNSYGATFELEVNDPTDYLPHTDGTPRAKQIRMANTTPDTRYVLVDYSKLDGRGSPAQSAQSFSSVKTGDTITVESADNILTAQKFDVTKVTLVKY